MKSDKSSYSTDNATFSLLNEISKREIIGGIFCDLQRLLIVLIMRSYY
jgi:hypothetical protein